MQDVALEPTKGHFNPRSPWHAPAYAAQARKLGHRRAPSSGGQRRRTRPQVGKPFEIDIGENAGALAAPRHPQAAWPDLASNLAFFPAAETRRSATLIGISIARRDEHARSGSAEVDESPRR
jgi:hypothetical protein